MSHVVRLALCSLATASICIADGERKVRGRVVDEVGRPVAGADVSFWWRANGPFGRDENGNLSDHLDTPEGRRIFTANFGKMFPVGLMDNPVQTGPDGRFSATLPDMFHHLMAIDGERKRGGLVIWQKSEATDDLEIRLSPRVQLKAAIEGPEPGRRHGFGAILLASLLDAEDPTRPFDSTRIAFCGSVDSSVQFALPPGRYLLEAYVYSEDLREKASVLPNRTIELSGEQSEIDLGVLHLSPFVQVITNDELRERASAEGILGVETQLYGQMAPEWTLRDARGVSRDVQVSDFLGKWVLVDFWGPYCNPCMKRDLPKLMKFYDTHEAQRDQFEILAICVEIDGELDSIDELDQKLQPVVEHFWGRPLPFPILLDSNATTWFRYGMRDFGKLLLIDPEGNVVEGDEATLAEKLKKP
jgi:thiol-disulfide isomerase/thioredoxin